MPKYAQIERERRWLVDPEKRLTLEALPFVLIEDRYICDTRLRLRRMTDDATVALKLTKKYEAPDPRARPIVTAYLTEGEYALLSTLPALCIRKRRFKLAACGHEFSLDQFEGDLLGLELLEIESLSDEALRAIITPSWTIREVSKDPQFQGGALAGRQKARLIELVSEAL